MPRSVSCRSSFPRVKAGDLAQWGADGNELNFTTVNRAMDVYQQIRPHRALSPRGKKELEIDAGLLLLWEPLSFRDAVAGMRTAVALRTRCQYKTRCHHMPLLPRDVPAEETEWMVCATTHY